jgi:acetate kinase
MPRHVLTVNTGSSSLKAGIFDIEGEPRPVGAASISGVNSPHAVLHLQLDAATPGPEEPLGSLDPGEAFGVIVDRLEPVTGPLAGIAHRVVHGGERFTAPQPITPELLEALEALTPLAPEHLPPALQAIDCAARTFPEVPQLACFDTAFHQHMPRLARLYPLRRSDADAGIRRYGFHGLSCEYVMHALGEIDPRAASGRLVIAHLGSGASLTAVRDGQSVDTTMGFSPTGGVMMATRSGDLDPGVILHLLTTGMAAQPLSHLLNRESGLLGISSRTSDMRELLALAPSDAAAAEAIALFAYLAKRSLGALIAVLGGLDTLVFTGGIGEHAALVRAAICDGMADLGIRVDAALNAAPAAVISPPGQRVTVRVVPTDEELMLARHARALLSETAPHV